MQIYHSIAFLEEKGQVGCADLLCYKCKNGFLKHVDKYYRNKCLKKCPDGYAKMKNRCRGKVC